MSAELRTRVQAGFRWDTSDPQFVWQFAHSPGRYLHLRTPALFHMDPGCELLSQLSEIAREKFGCAEISPPWISLYTDGCFQNWHSDRPHGPWGFVLSLSSENPRFLGGRTMVARPELLDFWSHATSAGDRHVDSYVEHWSARLGDLLVFDSRLPHAVEKVWGTEGPEQGRMVLHGWFTQPRPWVEGPHSLLRVQKTFNIALESWLTTVPNWTGTIWLRAVLGATGSAQWTCFLSTAQDLDERSPVTSRNPRVRQLLTLLNESGWGKAAKPSAATFPLIFE